MLVIIVSLGFGIVKPRLGPTLHRIVGIGFLYFIIASTEAVLRVIKPKNDISSGTMLAGIPLAVIDRFVTSRCAKIGFLCSHIFFLLALFAGGYFRP